MSESYEHALNRAQKVADLQSAFHLVFFNPKDGYTVVAAKNYENYALCGDTLMATVQPQKVAA